MALTRALMRAHFVPAFTTNRTHGVPPDKIHKQGFKIHLAQTGTNHPPAICAPAASVHFTHRIQRNPECCRKLNNLFRTHLSSESRGNLDISLRFAETLITYFLPLFFKKRFLSGLMETFIHLIQLIFSQGDVRTGYVRYRRADWGRY